MPAAVSLREDSARTATRTRRPRNRWIAAAVVLALLAACGVVALVLQPRKHGRPDLQRVIQALVATPGGIAPGATAAVIRSDGTSDVTWSGAVGVANVLSGTPMRPDSRMRLASVSKIWLTAVVLQLVHEGRLSLADSVDHWLPGVLPYGGRITLGELMTDSSGLIDDNDLNASPAALAMYLSRVKDTALRQQLTDLATRLQQDPNLQGSPMWAIRLAAWQPLLFAPGTRYHHSNIGWNLAGMITERAGGEPLAALYQHRIFGPLHLTHSAYDPQGPIQGAHAQGYTVGAGAALSDATGDSFGKGADGGIVSDAADTATFLRALMAGRLVPPEQLAMIERDNLAGFASQNDGCGGTGHVGNGASAAYKVNVWVNDDGGRVAVLLLNGRVADGSGDTVAAEAARQLYCGAERNGSS